MLDVCLLGTGGMMPLPKRWLSSLMLRLNGSCLLIDCGEGTQIAMRESGWSFHPIDTICITHFHGDHISGLIGLLLSMGNAEREEPVTIIGPKGLEKVVTAMRIIAPELPFVVDYIEINDKEALIERKDYHIRAFRLNHNITCYGYSIEVKRAGRFQPELAKKNEVPLKLWNSLQKGKIVELDGKKYTPDMILGPERKGIKLTYCTDTRPTPRIVEEARHSDLFICEGMYGEDGMEQKANVHRHMTFGEAATLAKEADVSELWLTHYSPSMMRPELYLDKAREIFPNTKTCRDGKTTTLEFNKNE